MAGNIIDTAVSDIIKTYITDSDVCMAETLAFEKVPSGMTYEEAFKAYIKAMKEVEKDRFFTVKDGETIEL